MGLDMYLSKQTFIRQDDRERLELVGAPSTIDPKKVETITEQAGYWRKANAIHRWFVENVQAGQDDCKRYYVSREKLAQLLDTVDAVLASCELVDGTLHNGTKYENGNATPILEPGKIVKDPRLAQALLPTTSGFFFGSTDYDQYYVEDLRQTQRILTEALAADDTADFYYESSW